MDVLIWVCIALQLLTIVIVLVIHDGVKYSWRELLKINSIVSSIQSSVITRQSQLRTRYRSDETVAHVDPKPKVEQPYAGVQRTASGAEETETGGEGPTARIVPAKRIRSGGKDGDDPNRRLQQGR